MTLRRLLVAVVALFVVVAGVGGTEGTLVDVEATSIQFAAASDLTVQARLTGVSPEAIVVGGEDGPGNGKPTTFDVSLVVENPDRVADDAFTLELAGLAGQVDAVAVREKRGEFTVSFDAAAVANLTGDAPGTYDFVVRGWWDYGRAFEASGIVLVEAATADGTTTTTSDPTVTGTDSGTADGTNGSATSEPTVATAPNGTTDVGNETSVPASNETVDTGTNETVDTGTNETVVSPTDETTEQTTDQSATAGTNESVGTSTNASASSEPGEASTNSTNGTTNESVDGSTGGSTDDQTAGSQSADAVGLATAWVAGTRR